MTSRKTHETEAIRYLTDEEQLRHCKSSLEEIAELLDKAITAIAGPEATWSPGPPYEGVDPVLRYDVWPSAMRQLCEAREEANGVLAWVEETHESGSIEWIDTNFTL